ncbi:MAG TPA: chemotaxis protein CheW, partial [Gammaproteobacteria bacterium]
LGIANVRGNLLPVMDLQGFLGAEPTPQDAAVRVLAIRNGDFSSGVLVSAVSGLQQIDVEARTAELPAVDPALHPYLTEGFRVGDSVWPIFDFARLATHGGFIQAAA